MSAPKARAAVERAAFGGDCGETRDSRRRVMAPALGQIANAATPALLQRVADGHAFCIRCAARLAPASTSSGSSKIATSLLAILKQRRKNETYIFVGHKHGFNIFSPWVLEPYGRPRFSPHTICKSLFFFL
jgi:hypothetical protein